MQVTLVHFSSRPVGEKLLKGSSVLMHKRFKEGRQNVEDAKINGRPKSHRTDENVEEVRNLVHSDRHLSVTAMALQLNLDK
jgi:hypothetical protein